MSGIDRDAIAQAWDGGLPAVEALIRKARYDALTEAAEAIEDCPPSMKWIKVEAATRLLLSLRDQGGS